MTVNDLNPATYAPICKLVPISGLEIKVEELSAFGKKPLEVTIRAACGHQATFLYHWGIAADEAGWPRHEVRPVVIICPPDLLKEVYERGKEDGRKEMADALLDAPSSCEVHGS